MGVKRDAGSKPWQDQDRGIEFKCTGPDGGADTATSSGTGPEHSSLTRGAGKEVGRGRKVVAQVIPNPAAGTNGHRGRTISASKGGARQEEEEPIVGERPP